MGGMKDVMEHERMLDVAAGEALRRSGIADLCRWHGELSIARIYSKDDERHAYALGSTMVNNGEVQAEHADMSAAIKRRLDMMPWECSGCAKDEAA